MKEFVNATGKIKLIEYEDIENIDPRELLDMADGFTISQYSGCRIGDWYDIRLTIRKNEGFFTTSDEVIATFKNGKKISPQFYYGCFDSYGLWNVESFGYIAVGSDITHKSTATAKYLYTRIHITGILR